MTMMLSILLLAQIGPFDLGTSDARTRRANREMAVQRAGEDSRQLVEEYGEAAVAALNNCSLSVCQQLALFHKEGKLRALAKPKELLVCIGKPGAGDDVARYILAHERELQDPDATDAVLAAPVDHALNLVSLQQSAATMRARRLAAREGGTAWHDDWRNLALAGGGVAVLFLLIRMRKRKAAPPIP